MHIEQKKWTPEKTWETLRSDLRESKDYQLVLVFGSLTLLSSVGFYEEIRNNYPKAQILMNSASAEIIDTQVNNETISLTAIRFDKTTFKTVSININEFQDSEEIGKSIADKFEKDQLTNILIFADGKSIDGTQFSKGIEKYISPEVIISGGLAGDQNNYPKTLLGLNEQPCEGKIIAVGFYGKHLTVSHEGNNGWEAFGEALQITKSNQHTILEINNEPALKIYNQYLDKNITAIHGQNLLFPISLFTDQHSTIIRRINAIHEDEKSITFDGIVPEGSYIKMMKANFETLINATTKAAKSCVQKISNPDLAIVISNVGRKILLNRRTEEEVEVLREMFGEATAITGFYSTGEISYIKGTSNSALYNQTMTITTMCETK